MGMMEELNKKIEAGTPAFVFRAIQPTFLWDTVVGYLTHCADNQFGEPVSILTYKLPAAEQIDSIKPVKEYLAENVSKDILGADLYTTFTTKTEVKYSGKNDVLIWNVLGESTLTLDDNTKDVEAGDLIYIPKNTEYKLKANEANAFVLFSLR